MLDLEVLGPLVVRSGGRKLRLGPALRALLLCLLCAQGEPVPAARLAALTSGTGRSEASPATLRSHVSHLRRAVRQASGQGWDDGQGIVLTERVGGSTAYALSLDSVQVDAARFERDTTLGIQELQRGNPSFAADTLRAALELWRGQPLADVSEYPFAQAEIRRLEAAHRAALIARVHADVHCGLERSVVGDLEAMADWWPDDEALRVALIICLYRSGRTAEAARACRVAAEFMLQHGLESPRLTALQSDVLNGTVQATGMADFLVWPATSSIGPGAQH